MKLSDIYIPESVASIGNGAFSGCDILTDINVDQANKYFSSEQGVLFNKDKTAILQCPGGKQDDYYVPESVNVIMPSAFLGCSNLKSVHIPNSVTTIGNRAFGSCHSLNEVDLKAALTAIEDNTFYNCINLNSITIPSSVKSIGASAFENCSMLPSINIPQSMSAIDPTAFIYCNDFEAFNVDEGNQNFSSKEGVLFNKNKTELVLYPGGKKGDYIIPNSVETIGPRAFYSSWNLSSVTIPNSVSSIGEYAFSYCYKLSSITLPESVIHLGKGIFYRSSLLESVTLPLAISTIPEFAFASCSKLKSIEIPKSVKSIGTSAFMSDLEKISCMIADPCSVTYGEYIFPEVTYTNAVLSVPEESVNKYKEVDPWKNFSNIVGLQAEGDTFSYEYEGQTLYYTVLDEVAKTVKTREGYLDSEKQMYISGNTASGDLVIPATVKDGETEYSVIEIGQNAFFGAGCQNITSVTIPNSVVTIGANAFNGCEGLTSVNIPESVTEIGEYAFTGCSMSSIKISDSVTNIKEYTFSGCSKLSSVTFGKALKSIDEYAFYQCTGLTSLTIPNSVTSIGTAAFRNCKGLTSLTIGSSVIEIGSSAFYDCSSLNDMTLGNSIATIGANAFRGCRRLTSIDIPNSVSIIGDRAFQGCKEIKSLVIPNSITSIGIRVFSECTAIEKINSMIQDPAKVTYGENIFAEAIYANAVLSVPDESVNKYKETDPWKNFSKIEALQADSDTFSYEYDGVMLNYTVIDREAKTCAVTKLTYPDSFSGSLSIPSDAMNGGVPYKVTGIGDSAFSHCKNLTTISLPNTLKTIGNGSFGMCENLTSIDIPNSVESIGYMAFYRDIKLQDIHLGNSIKSIGENTFYYCPIETIEIPNSLTELSNSIFDGCEKLKSVELHNDITAIGERAFWRCSSLTSIEIPGSVKSIGRNAFMWCGLETITCMITDPGSVTYGEDIFTEAIYANAVLSVPEGSLNKYKETDPWKNFSKIEALPTSGIEEVSADLDMTLPYAVYNLNGVMVADSLDTLPTGIYVVRQGNKVRKLAIK